MWWRILVIFLAYLLLGAHFLRYNQPLAAVGFSLAPLLIFIPNTIITRALQFGLLASTLLVWGVTTIEYIEARMAVSHPWARLAVIMTAVMIFTLMAAYSANDVIKLRRQSPSQR
ncbi:hypothetical protein [Shewanella sp. NIFS-20-20]|uniref:hypothetical protein n=1 Tax=Shewanella sp. NIFS-20-20 TaxID=2853806 RepID=UPI001C481860|nr:hypothetical protein [Shewanella sp. NIFS-20-20]MBV7317220.1 hypothetical protein [Shewanella sp. NIFS-20-20]